MATPTRTIVDIEFKTESIDAFADKVKALKGGFSDLEKHAIDGALTGGSGKSSGKIKGSSNALKSQLGDTSKLKSLYGSLVDQSKKLTSNTEKFSAAKAKSIALSRELLKITKATAAASGKLSRDLAGTIKLISFLSIGGLASILGGGFGLKALAGGAQEDRNSALSTGLSVGRNKAAEAYYGNTVFHGQKGELNSALSKINESKQQWTEKGLLASMGISYKEAQKMDSLDILHKYLAQTAKLDIGKDELNSQYAETYKKLGIQPARIRDIHNNQDILERARIQTLQNQASLNTSTKTSNVYESGLANMDAVWDKVVASIRVSFAGIMPAISRLLSSIGKDITKVMRSEGMRQVIDKFAVAVDTFSEWLVSPEFQEAIEIFIASMKKMAGVAGVILGENQGEKYGRIINQYQALNRGVTYRDMPGNDKKLVAQDIRAFFYTDRKKGGGLTNKDIGMQSELYNQLSQEDKNNFLGNQKMIAGANSRYNKTNQTQEIKVQFAKQEITVRVDASGLHVVNVAQQAQNTAAISSPVSGTLVGAR